LLKWGPFFDSAPRSLRCTLVPPATARRSVTLEGTASCDGIRTPVTGSGSMASGSRLLCVREAGQPGATMRLQGCVGGEYAIEGSTDLRNWTTLLTVTNRMGQVELPQFEEPKTGNSYYRARLVR